jgi:hypothetical protein
MVREQCSFVILTMVPATVAVAATAIVTYELVKTHTQSVQSEKSAARTLEERAGNTLIYSTTQST